MVTSFAWWELPRSKESTAQGTPSGRTTGSGNTKWQDYRLREHQVAGLPAQGTPSGRTTGSGNTKWQDWNPCYQQCFIYSSVQRQKVGENSYRFLGGKDVNDIMPFLPSLKLYRRRKMTTHTHTQSWSKMKTKKTCTQKKEKIVSVYGRYWGIGVLGRPAGLWRQTWAHNQDQSSISPPEFVCAFLLFLPLNMLEAREKIPTPHKSFRCCSQVLTIKGKHPAGSHNPHSCV